MRCPDCRIRVPSGVKTCRDCGGDVSAIDSMRIERNMLFAVFAVGSAFIGILTFVGSY